MNTPTAAQALYMQANRIDDAAGTAAQAAQRIIGATIALVEEGSAAHETALTQARALHRQSDTVTQYSRIVRLWAADPATSRIGKQSAQSALDIAHRNAIDLQKKMHEVSAQLAQYTQAMIDEVEELYSDIDTQPQP